VCGLHDYGASVHCERGVRIRWSIVEIFIGRLERRIG
jgi:hypothetical protein